MSWTRTTSSTLLAKHAGTARFAWNWGLARRKEALECGERVPNAIEQNRDWNRWKHDNAPWAREVSKCAPQESLRNLDQAFANFWRARKEGRAVGFPKFKKKGRHDSFRLTGSIRVAARAVALPRLGAMRTKERTDVKGRILSATVSREADRWYVALTVERERPEPRPVQGPAVGVDLGLSCFAVLSDGTIEKAPKPFEALLKNLKRRSRRHARKLKGSSNRRKSALRLARLHRRIRNIRKDFLHKLTTRLAKTKSAIVVEDLCVRGMVRNRHLSRSISDAGWAEFRRMLEYKTRWYGSTLVVAPRAYLSTRRCSVCGQVGPRVPLDVRVFHCSACAFECDRDLNAAKNLEALNTASSAGIYARGDSSVGGTVGDYRSTRYGSLRRESDAIVSIGING